MDYYVKQGKKYIRAGYSSPDMGDGLYFREHKSGSVRTTSVAYWAGLVPQPIDVNRLISLMRLDDKIAGWLVKIQDENSPEYEKFKEESGGYVKEPPRICNVSMQDLAAGMLRRLYENELNVK